MWRKNNVVRGNLSLFYFLYSGWCPEYTDPPKTTMDTSFRHGPLARYVKLRVAIVPRMPRTFSPPPRVSDPDMHHGTCVTHVPWCMPGSLSSGFLCSRWRGKRSRHSRRMRNQQFCVSGKRPIFANGGLFWLSIVTSPQLTCDFTRTRDTVIVTAQSSNVLSRGKWRKIDLH